jgi:hypothetical protein
MDLVYWDSNAFLGLLNGEAKKAQACEDVWNAAVKGELKIVTSTLTVAEVIYIKNLPKLDPQHRPKLNNYFRQPHLVLEPLTRPIVELARDIVWDLNIKPKDSVHIATCGFHKIPILNTYDDQLLALKNVTLNGYTFNLMKPHTPAQGEMAV